MSQDGSCSPTRSSEERALPVLAGAAASRPRLSNQVAAAVQCALSLAFLRRLVCFVVTSPGQSRWAFCDTILYLIYQNQDLKAVLYISFIFLVNRCLAKSICHLGTVSASISSQFACRSAATTPLVGMWFFDMLSRWVVRLRGCCIWLRNTLQRRRAVAAIGPRNVGQHVRRPVPPPGWNMPVLDVVDGTIIDQWYETSRPERKGRAYRGIIASPDCMTSAWAKLEAGVLVGAKYVIILFR